MTSLDHRVGGVDHAAFPTFDPAGTVHFYRDVLGFPVVHSICAVGWGPEDHPDFIHFFFDIGDDDRIAFFYYFGAEAFNQTGRGDAYAGFGPEVPLSSSAPPSGGWRPPETRAGHDGPLRARRTGEHRHRHGGRRRSRRVGRAYRPVLRDHRQRRDHHLPPRHRVPPRGLVQRGGRPAPRQPRHPARQERPAGGARVSAPFERPSAERLGAGRYLTAGSRPESAVTSVHELATADGAAARGVLVTVPGATTVISLMHPRQDL